MPTGTGVGQYERYTSFDSASSGTIDRTAIEITGYEDIFLTPPPKRGNKKIALELFPLPREKEVHLTKNWLFLNIIKEINVEYKTALRLYEKYSGFPASGKMRSRIKRAKKEGKDVNTSKMV